MSKVLFIASYKIPEAQRTEYFEQIGRIKAHFTSAGIEYNAFETKGKRNYFKEVIIYPSQDSFDNSDEITEKINDTIEKIYEFASETKFETAIEI